MTFHTKFLVGSKILNISIQRAKPNTMRYPVTMGRENLSTILGLPQFNIFIIILQGIHLIHKCIFFIDGIRINYDVKETHFITVI